MSKFILKYEKKRLTKKNKKLPKRIVKLNRKLKKIQEKNLRQKQWVFTFNESKQKWEQGYGEPQDY